MNVISALYRETKGLWEAMVRALDPYEELRKAFLRKRQFAWKLSNKEKSRSTWAEKEYSKSKRAEDLRLGTE